MIFTYKLVGLLAWLELEVHLWIKEASRMYTIETILESERSSVYEAYKETMKEYVENTFGWDEEKQLRGFRSLDLEKLDAIRKGSEVMGYLITSPMEKEIFIFLFLVMKRYRGKGHGSEILSIAESRFTDLGFEAVQGKVLKGNPALSFWEKCGYEILPGDTFSYKIQKSLMTFRSP